jgi:hypothetical protein
MITYALCFILAHLLLGGLAVQYQTCNDLFQRKYLTLGVPISYTQNAITGRDA